MREILEAYRISTSPHELARRVAEFLKEILNCESISIFEHDEITRHLTLFYSTAKKYDEVKTFLNEESLVYSIYRKNQDILVNNDILKEYLQPSDIFFEDSKRVFSMAYARIFDCYNKPVGLIRTLNKHSKEGTLIDFSKSDLNILIDSANILGSGLVALNAHLRATAFLDSVTHELLAPMSGAKGAAKFLIGYISNETEESTHERNARIISNLNDIISSADASISLVQGITMFSKSGRMSKRDLEKKSTRMFSEVLSKSISNVSSLIAARNFDRSKIEPVDYNNWPLLNIDRKIMEQVFSNLLSNAVKYAFDDPESFSIDILVECLANGNVTFRIRDYGIGIDTKDASRIFQPGERGQRARAKVPTGMGIGLTTVQRLLDIHDMTIELSNFNMPTEFLIRIPKQFVIRRY